MLIRHDGRLQIMRGTQGKAAAGRNGRTAEMIAVGSMLLAAAAMGAGLHLHLGLAVGPAIALSILLGAMFIGIRSLAAQSKRVASLGAELARLELEIERLKGRAPSADVRPQFAARPQEQPAAPAEMLKASMPSGPPPMAAPAGHAPKTADQKAAVAEANSVLLGPLDAPRQVHASQIQDAWSFRPAQPRFDTPPSQELHAPTFAKGPARGTAPVVPAPELPHARSDQRVNSPVTQTAAPAPVPTLREADVEMIQGLIKKLADDVNAADILPQSAAAAVPSIQQPAPHARSDRAPAAPAVAAAANAAIDQSVGALRRVAGTMSAPPQFHDAHPPMRAQPHQEPLGAVQPPALRGTVGHEHAVPPQPPVSNPQPASAASVVRSEFLDAISAGRIDVLLEPIIGLGDLRARHFEVSLRILDRAGDAVEASPRSPLFAGSGLLPLLDRARMERSAGVARRIDQRGKGGSVFSEFSRDSLTDREFLLGAKAQSDANANFAGQLILSFSQSAVRHLSDTQWAALGALRTLGFRFAVQDVTDLDMDFARLAREGFTFVKLDADVFLEGLRAAHGIIPASDICRYLAGAGLTLIVGRVDDESERARLFGFGVMFGQGQLFGGARPMKVDALARTQNAAA